MALTCPTCVEGAAEYVGMADDGRNEMRCLACGHRWLLGARPVSPRAVIPKPVRAGRAPSASSRARRGAGTGGPGRSGPAAPPRSPVRPASSRRFPGVDDIEPTIRARIPGLVARFHREGPGPDPDLPDFRRLYELAFSPAGLPHVEPQLLKEFANGTAMAHPGNVSVFNREWNRLGDRDGARAVRGVVEYLLRGDPEEPEVAPEDRFTRLVDPSFPRGMTGFRESLLTRVLCVAEPERFLPILVYTSAGSAGKREVARDLLGLELPAPDRTTHTVGRLAHRSNDLLLDALGPGLRDLDEAGRFLRWATDQD